MNTASVVAFLVFALIVLALQGTMIWTFFEMVSVVRRTLPELNENVRSILANQTRSAVEAAEDRLRSHVDRTR